MNAVFTAIFLISAALAAAFSPEEFLSSLISGTRHAVSVALTLFCVYAVWMGLAAVAEECGITKKTAKLITPLCRRLFKTTSPAACEAAAMNLTCDLLGAGASTPFAVKAIAEFEKEGNSYGQKMLFLINCAGFQIIPSTVIALRASYGSAAAADIFLPSLICSGATLALSIVLFLLTERIGAAARRNLNVRKRPTAQAGTRRRRAKNECAIKGGCKR